MAPPIATQGRGCQLQASENFHLERMDAKPIQWHQKDAASLAKTKPPFQPVAAGLSSDQRPGERMEIDQLHRRRSPQRREVVKSPRNGPGVPQRHGYWNTLNTMEPRACDISSVSRKRHENSISYGFYGLAPSAQAATPQDAVYSPKALASDEAVGKRQEYFETATSAVQFSPDCTWHYEVMEQRREAQDFAKTLGRPGAGSRLSSSGASRSARSARTARSTEPEALRWEPGARRKVKPGLPEAARGSVRSQSPTKSGRTPTTVEMLEKIDPRELMLKDLKSRVDELVKQTGVLHQLREPKGEGTSPRHYGTRGKKNVPPSADMGSPATVSTASPQGASPLSTSLAPAAHQW